MNHWCFQCHTASTACAFIVSSCLHKRSCSAGTRSGPDKGSGLARHEQCAGGGPRAAARHGVRRATRNGGSSPGWPARCWPANIGRPAGRRPVSDRTAACPCHAAGPVTHVPRDDADAADSADHAGDLVRSAMPAIWYISYAATAARNRAAGPMRVVGPGLREAGPPAEVAAPNESEGGPRRRRRGAAWLSPRGAGPAGSIDHRCGERRQPEALRSVSLREEERRGGSRTAHAPRRTPPPRPPPAADARRRTHPSPVRRYYAG